MRWTPSLALRRQGYGGQAGARRLARPAEDAHLILKHGKG